MPRVLGGSSAGSIVTAIVATRTDEECFRDFFEVQGTHAPGHSGLIHTDFFRPVGYNGNETSASEVKEDAGLKRAFQLFIPLTLRNFSSFIYDILTGFKRPTDILKNDTRHLEACLRANIGDFTFQEAFDRTGRILNITVSPRSKSDPPRLLNYLTSPHVLIWSAALASASLPGVFEANRLMVKDPDGTERYESTSGMTFQDGSMEVRISLFVEFTLTIIFQHIISHQPVSIRLTFQCSNSLRCSISITSLSAKQIHMPSCLAHSVSSDRYGSILS
jgi:TAG lipase/steryl ester hydrolase/phospholipase A2/LPA acyltransferase